MPQRKGTRKLGATDEMLAPYREAKRKEAYGRAMDEDAAAYRRAGRKATGDYMEETAKMYYSQAERANMKAKIAGGSNPRQIKPDIQKAPLTYTTRGADGVKQKHTTSERPSLTRAKEGQKPAPKRK